MCFHSTTWPKPNNYIPILVYYLSRYRCFDILDITMYALRFYFIPTSWPPEKYKNNQTVTDFPFYCGFFFLQTSHIKCISIFLYINTAQCIKHPPSHWVLPFTGWPFKFELYKTSLPIWSQTHIYIHTCNWETYYFYWKLLCSCSCSFTNPIFNIVIWFLMPWTDGMLWE